MSTITGSRTDEVLKLRSEVYDLRAEVETLTEQLQDVGTSRMWWLQTKVWRQRNALDRLNRRVVAQRAILRRLDVLGRGLTREEWLALRDTVSPSVEEAFRSEGWMPPEE